MKWPWTKKKVKFNPDSFGDGTCVCAWCGEIVLLNDDCFCDRQEKGTLTEADKRFLKDHPDYVGGHE